MVGGGVAGGSVMGGIEVVEGAGGGSVVTEGGGGDGQCVFLVAMMMIRMSMTMTENARRTETKARRFW